MGCKVIVAQPTIFNICVNTQDAVPAWDLSVAPNPTDGWVGLSCHELKGKTVKMDLMTSNGQLIRSWQQTFDAESARLDLRDLSAGVYLLRVSDGSAQASVSIVVQ